MTWLVILVWVAALAFSAFWLARVGLSLAKKTAGFAKAVEPLAEQLTELAKISEAKVEYHAEADNLLDSPNKHLREVREQQKDREARARARQRRLINRLKP